MKLWIAPVLLFCALPSCGDSHVVIAGKEPNLTQERDACCVACVLDVTTHDVGQDGKLRLVIKSKSTQKELFSGLFNTENGRYEEASLKLFGKSVDENVVPDPKAKLSEFISRGEAMALTILAERTCAKCLVDQQDLQKDCCCDEACAHACSAVGPLIIGMFIRTENKKDRSRETDKKRDHCTLVPDMFPQSCEVHDKCYEKHGSSGIDRKACDDKFLMAMREEATDWTRPFVPLYHYAVRWFGWAFWNKD